MTWENGDPKCSALEFSLMDGAIYVEQQSLEIATATDGATINYTVTGLTTGTASGTAAQTATITFSDNDTYSVIAYVTKDGFEPSATSAISFTISKTECDAPVFSLEEDSYSAAQTLTITTATEGAQIEYTVNGAGAVTAASPVSLQLEMLDGAACEYVITATATLDGYADSETVSKTYYIVDPTLATEYVLVKKVDMLTAGAEVIIVGGLPDAPYAMAAQGDNNRAGKAVSIEDDGVTIKVLPTSTVEEFTIGRSSGLYTIHCSDGYLCAPSTSESNSLLSETELDSNGTWAVTVDSGTGEATVTANGGGTHNVMRYDSASRLFSCYDSDAAAAQSSVYFFCVPGTSGVSAVASDS